MDRVRGGMKVIYKKEKTSRRKYRTLWYTTIDRERKTCCNFNNYRDKAIRESLKRGCREKE